MRKQLRYLVWVAMALATAPVAVFAADAPVVQTRTFLSMLLEGAEWPGVLIVAMSLVSVTMIVEHFWTIRRSTIVPESEVEAARQMIEGRKFKECIEYIKGRKTMFADVLSTGLRHGRHGFDAMHEAVEERASAWSARLFRKVEYLNVIGNLGPLMGLLGTVLGMIRAFGAMQQAHGATKPENLAGGISLALVNTFLGLSVAIVSLGFFGICRNRVDSLTVAAHAAVLDLLEYFRPGAPMPATTKPETAKPDAAPTPAAAKTP
jgi:biopolymer transport protein ExbB